MRGDGWQTSGLRLADREDPIPGAWRRVNSRGHGAVRFRISVEPTNPRCPVTKMGASKAIEGSDSCGTALSLSLNESRMIVREANQRTQRQLFYEPARSACNRPATGDWR